MNTTANELPWPGSSAWKLSPESAHPKARILFTEPFFWDGIDDHAPWGSDEGSDALAALGKAHADRNSLPPVEFIFDYVGPRWSSKWPESSQTQREIEEYSVGHMEVIAVVLGMYLLHGFVPHEYKVLGLEAIDRELDPSALGLFGEPNERKKKLLIMREKLAQADDPPGMK